MVCGNCGAGNTEGARFCARCGRSLDIPAGASTPATGGAAAQSGPMPGMSPQAVIAATPTTSGKAVGSLICGFLSFFFPAAVVAIVLGHLGLSDINKSGGKLQGKGIAVAGLVLGYLGVAMIPFLLIIAAIAIPNLLRSRQAANEASAVGSLRTIESAAVSYNASYGNGYPPDLETLAGGVTPSCDHAGLIDGVLAGGREDGYIFTYHARESATQQAPATGCGVRGSSEGFTVNADPLTRGTTGQRSFYIDETGVIRYERDGPAGAESETLQ